MHKKPSKTRFFLNILLHVFEHYPVKNDFRIKSPFHQNALEAADGFQCILVEWALDPSALYKSTILS